MYYDILYYDILYYNILYYNIICYQMIYYNRQIILGSGFDGTFASVRLNSWSTVRWPTASRDGLPPFLTARIPA